MLNLIEGADNQHVPSDVPVPLVTLPGTYHWLSMKVLLDCVQVGRFNQFRAQFLLLSPLYDTCLDKCYRVSDICSSYLCVVHVS